MWSGDHAHTLSELAYRPARTFGADERTHLRRRAAQRRDLAPSAPAGQSSRIKFADLRAMLEERDRRAQVELAKAAGALADVGTANAIILDTDRNTLNTNGRPIILDEKLIEQIKR